MLFRSVAESLSQGGVFQSLAYTPDKAEELFNAGCAAFAIFDLNPSVSKEFLAGLLLAIHKNDAAVSYQRPTGE